MPPITPALWFDNNLAEAAEFYTSVFPNSSVEHINDVSATFVLDGHRFVGINGGPAFAFTEAVSFMVGCRDQDEVDFYWDRLVDGGEESRCGWLKDRFGLSWQIVPDRLLRADERPESGPGPGRDAGDVRNAQDRDRGSGGRRRLRVSRPGPGRGLRVDQPRHVRWTARVCAPTHPPQVAVPRRSKYGQACR